MQKAIDYDQRIKEIKAAEQAPPAEQAQGAGWPEPNWSGWALYVLSIVALGGFLMELLTRLGELALCR